MELVTDNTRQYETLTRMIRNMQEQMTEMKDSISDLKVMRNAIAGDIKLDNTTLEIILNVSDSTLYRWRNSAAPQNLPFYTYPNGIIYYDFNEVLEALQKGQLNARGFERLKAIERMVDYREDLMYGRVQILKSNR